LQVFKNNPGITFRTVEHPEAQELFKSRFAGEYDVLVFYDMWQTISEEAKSDLLERLSEGKGVVGLHHCLASFQSWETYKNIIGGRYHRQCWTDAGVVKPPSTYRHDVDFTVRVADPDHPVTRGVKDFVVHDETYSGVEVVPNAQVLLTTDEPTNCRQVAWARTYGPARVVYLQLGHDHYTYENLNYRRLVDQAIEWVATPQRTPSMDSAARGSNPFQREGAPFETPSRLPLAQTKVFH
jgi:type 1 glutamine amidotransferase